MHTRRWTLALTIVLILTALLPLAPAQAATATFTNAASIAIPTGPGTANPYPSPIAVSGLSGTITKVTVTLSGMNHTFPDDLDVLLVGPGGQSSVLMSDVGGGNDIVNGTITFDDAAGSFIADGGPLASGTYRPTEIGPGDPYPAPAPAGPHGAALALFIGTTPNGTWSLYVVDDLAGDGGSIGGGWSLTITTSASAPVVPGATPVVAPPWDPGDGRLNPEAAAPLAIYCDADSVYAYQIGFLEFDFPLDQIGPAPVAPAPQRTLLAEHADGTRLYQLSTGEYQIVSVVNGQEQTAILGNATTGHTLLATGVSGARLYRLNTGELQVNLVHGGEEYVFTWDGCPATRAITRVYDVNTRALLAEYARAY